MKGIKSLLKQISIRNYYFLGGGGGDLQESGFGNLGNLFTSYLLYPVEQCIN